MLPNLVHSCSNLRHQMFPIMLRTKYKFFNLAYKILHGLATISPNSSTTLSYSIIWANISPFPHNCLNIKFIVNINPMHQLFTLSGMFSQIFAQLAASYNSQLFQIPHLRKGLPRPPNPKFFSSITVYLNGPALFIVQGIHSSLPHLPKTDCKPQEYRVCALPTASYILHTYSGSWHKAGTP